MAKAAKGVPDGYHTITPQLTLDNAAEAIEWYRSRGVVSTRPELEHVDMLSDRIAAVDVRWPALDAFGRETASERSHYIVQQGSDDRVRIRVALARNATDGNY